MQNTPKQCKLLGATVKNIGVVVAVSSTLADCYALIEDISGVPHHRFVTDLKRDEVSFPAQLQPYYTATERIGYGTWDEIHSLIPTQAILKLAV